jgi:hypothetical protein
MLINRLTDDVDFYGPEAKEKFFEEDNIDSRHFLYEGFKLPLCQPTTDFTNMPSVSSIHGMTQYKFCVASYFHFDAIRAGSPATTKTIPVSDAMSKALRFLKTEALDILRREDPFLDESRIHWVLSVPAILSDHAKVHPSS